jgi:uncharacterized membrane protein YccC
MTATPHANPEGHTAPPRWTARFERLLTRQIELCQELAALAERQRSCIDGDDPDSLLAVLSERQAVINRLRETAEEAAPLRERWSAARFDDPETRATGVRELINRLTDLMRQIAERDAEDRQRLNRARDALAGRLAGVARSRGALAAYGPTGSRGPRFQDREG